MWLAKAVGIHKRRPGIFLPYVLILMMYIFVLPRIMNFTPYNEKFGQRSPTLPLLFCIKRRIIRIAIDDLIPERSLEESNTFEELRRRERELADFIENACVGLHRVGADGTIL